MRNRDIDAPDAVKELQRRCLTATSLITCYSSAVCSAITGLSEEQVDRLRDEFGVYLIASGRMCVAPGNASNVHRVAGICRCHQQYSGRTAIVPSG